MCIFYLKLYHDSFYFIYFFVNSVNGMLSIFFLVIDQVLVLYYFELKKKCFKLIVSPKTKLLMICFFFSYKLDEKISFLFTIEALLLRSQ